MTTFRTLITVENPNEIVLTNVPVQPGDRVEVLVRPQSAERAANVDRMKKLLGQTHTLPQLQAITDDDIATEIDAYRKGQ